MAFFTEGTYRGKKRVNAQFTHGGNNYCIPVTDYEYERRFPAYSNDEADCLLTISLGMPFEVDDCCYKFVAGVITLDPPRDHDLLQALANALRTYLQTGRRPPLSALSTANG